MKTSVLVAVCLLIAACEAICDIDKLVNAINGFSQRLYQQVAVSKETTVLSTFSTHEELSILLLGARNNTAAELSTALGLDVFNPWISPHQTYKAFLAQLPCELLVYTTLINLAGHLQTPYVDEVKKYYLAHVLKFHNEGPTGEGTLYFPNQNNIQITNTGYYNDFSASLINIVVFNGVWQQPFSENKTWSDDFITPIQHLQLPTVHDQRSVNIKRNIYYADVAELPFANNRFSFYIALPHDVGGLPALESQLNSADAVNELFTNLVPTWVELSIPKFSIWSTFLLTSALQTMGIRDAFDPYLANFQGISNSSYVYIPQVLHGSHIEFTEYGILTPAGTGSIVYHTGATLPESFKVNHPFIFFLRDKALNITLFQGKFSG